MINFNNGTNEYGLGDLYFRAEFKHFAPEKENCMILEKSESLDNATNPLATGDFEKNAFFGHVGHFSPGYELIGHFRVLLCLCFKTRLRAKPFI